MVKKSARLNKRSAAKKVKRIRTVKKRTITRGALGAGTMYAVVALMIIALGATMMVGNIVPLNSTSPIGGQPVIISPPNLEKQKDNLQLFTFPGITYTPTPEPTIPPQPQQSWGSGSEGKSEGGNKNSGGGGGGDGNSAPKSGGGGGGGGSSGGGGGGQSSGGIAR